MTTQKRINNAVMRFLTEDEEEIYCRKFDNNFEMGDGDQVVIGIYKEAIDNLHLMECIVRYMGQRCIDGWEKVYKNDIENRKGLNI